MHLTQNNFPITSKLKVLIVGASGFLGREIYKTFKKDLSFQTFGTAKNRCGQELLYLNLLDTQGIVSIFNAVSPDFLIYCAAQKDLVLAEKEPEITLRLNATAVEELAALCQNAHTRFLYLSTDYVFDGTTPPYKPNSKTNPTNYYGKTKLLGEQYTLKNNNKHCVLRLPLLYGPVKHLNESWITSIINPLLSTKIIACDNHSIRFPTLTNDVAQVCLTLLKKMNCTENFNGIYHWSSNTAYTKYEIALELAAILNIKDHLIVISDEITKSPYNCQLDCSDLKSFISIQTPLVQGLKSLLSDLDKNFGLLAAHHLHF